MREIKFRAWNKELKEYVNVKRFVISPSNGSVIEAGVYDMPEISGNAVLEQYTGLKDKNGVEIYENDVLKSVGGNIEVVIYIDGRFEPICWYNPESFEVIGNVHQNYDLLADDIERMIPDDIGNDIHEFLHGGDK